MAHNIARQVLEESVEKAFNDFTDEKNFNSTPLYWPEKFKKAGFRLRLVFFCLNSITEAKRRVQIRVENGGHFVPDDEIIERYNLGFENLNRYWSYFDEVYLFDTSSYKQEPKFFLSIINHKMINLMIYLNIYQILFLI
jgi:predicted ABC-type ATPase